MVTVLMLDNATPVLVNVPEMYGMNVLVRVCDVTLGTIFLQCVRLLTEDVMMPETRACFRIIEVVALL